MKRRFKSAIGDVVSHRLAGFKESQHLVRRECGLQVTWRPSVHGKLM